MFEGFLHLNIGILIYGLLKIIMKYSTKNEFSDHLKNENIQEKQYLTF